MNYAIVFVDRDGGDVDAREIDPCEMGSKEWGALEQEALELGCTLQIISLLTGEIVRTEC